MRYNEFGEELPSTEPVEVPVKFRMTKEDEIHFAIRKALMSHAIAQKLSAQGFDTEEEANDFDVEDEEELPLSPSERAHLLAEELRQRKEDMVALEGAVKEGAKDGNSASGSRKGGIGKGGSTASVAGSGNVGDSVGEAKQSVDGKDGE